MSTQQAFVVRTWAAASPEAVWRLLADARSWSRWSFIPAAALEVEGAPDPDGVGAIRAFGAGPVRSREEVVAFEPPHHLGYTILSGVPVRGYRADVELTSDGPGTLITWRASFAPAIPGTGALLRVLFGKVVIADLARRLAREASC